MSALGRVPESVRARVAAVVLRVAPPLLTEPVVRLLAAATVTTMQLLRRPVVGAARENLRVVLGAGVPERQLERTLRASLRTYYAHWWSMLRLPALGPEGVSAVVTLSGLEHLPADRGTVLVGAHMGRYEWATGALSTALRERTGRGVLGVARVFGSPVTEATIGAIRSAAGNLDMLWLSPDSRVRPVTVLMERLRSDGVVGMMIDRFPVGAVTEVGMFGRTVALASSPVAIAARTGAALVPITCWVEPSGTVHYDLHPEVTIPPAGTGPDPERWRAALETVATVYEKEIAAHPEAWHVPSAMFR